MFRLMGSVAVTISDPDKALVDFQKRIYRLAPSWQTTGRLDPDHPQGIYLMAHHGRSSPGHSAPAIVDALAEFQADFGGVLRAPE